MTAKSKTTQTKAPTVSEYAKRHRMDAKVLRRQLRAVAKKPKSGWRITPAIEKALRA